MNTLSTILVLTGMGLTVPPESDPGPPQAPPVQAPPVAPAGTSGKLSPVVAPGDVTAPSPAPTLQRWQWWDAQGNTWFTWETGPPQVMPPSRPLLLSPPPFAQSPALSRSQHVGESPTIRTIPVTSAAEPSTSFTAPVRAGLTLTDAGRAATSGITRFTGCTSFG